MAKKKKKAAAPEIRTLALMEPGVADAAYAAVAAEHVWTMDARFAYLLTHGLFSPEGCAPDCAECATLARVRAALLKIFE